jgi:hypothetical protein
MIDRIHQPLGGERPRWKIDERWTGFAGLPGHLSELNAERPLSESVWEIRRDKGVLAAEKAAPYVHAHLNATDIHVSHSVAGTDAEIDAEIEALREKVNRARSAALPVQQMIETTVESVELARPGE